MKAHQLGPGVFVTGLSYSGITIYNQQVRTLNLIYQLREKRHLQSPPKEIVIIGGGISGVTAAMALLKLGYSVSMLEEKSILLHLQHGCTTRKIHPHLYKWPEADSLKPFTELPIGNWEAGDASTIERNLVGQFGQMAKNSKMLRTFYQVSELKIITSNKAVRFTYKDVRDRECETEIKYSLLLIATGFGLERYVGGIREKAKSYWRNDDYSQLRIGNQVNKFLVSGVGDGGAYDVCRLMLTAFDPVTWANYFESIEINKNRLIDDLREIHSKTKFNTKYNFQQDFELLYLKFKSKLDSLFVNHKRHDIQSVVLNGRGNLKDNLSLAKLSFINCWLLYLLDRKGYLKYEQGDFPDDCGEWLFIDRDEKEHVHIVRHGVDIDKLKIKVINKRLFARIDHLKSRQRSSSLNEFTREPQWPLEYWTNDSEYAPKKFNVSPKLQQIASIFLHTIEGQINHFVKENFSQTVDFRVTLHRLVRHNDGFLFQQIAPYAGTRSTSDGDVGRAFPVARGVVGLAMRTSTAIYLTRRIDQLFQFNEIVARHLPNGVNSLMAIPVPTINKQNGSVMCLYLDSKEAGLVQEKSFRKILIWAMSSFIKKLDSLNVSETSISGGFNLEIDPILDHKDIYKFNDELIQFWSNNELKFSSENLIEVYDKG